MSRGRNRAGRRVPTKAELVARLPRLVRPKLDRGQVRDLALCHVMALDDIAHGRAQEETLWDWVGGVLTWHHTAHALGMLTAEMTAAGEMAHRLIERFEQTGRIGFSGPDYQLAKDAVAWMDQLAAITDQPTAEAAAMWSERTVQALADQCFERRMAAARRAA